MNGFFNKRKFKLVYFITTSPSESDDDDELLEELTLDDDEESDDSDEDSEDELLDVDEELELLSLFLTTGFFPLPLCSCSSCLASSLCSICSFRSNASSSSCSRDFSHSPLSADLELCFVVFLVLLPDTSFRLAGLRLRLLFLPSLPDEVTGLKFLLLCVSRNLHLFE